MNEQRLDFCRRTMGVQHAIRLSDNVEKDLRDLTDAPAADSISRNGASNSP